MLVTPGALSHGHIGNKDDGTLSGSGRFPRADQSSLILNTCSARNLCVFRAPRTSQRCNGRLVWNGTRSEEHTSELQSLMRISYAVFCLKKKTNYTTVHNEHRHL